MDPRIKYVKREILASGSDDWVHAAEVAAFAREALYGDHIQDGYPENDHSVEMLAVVRDEWLARQEREALPLGIKAIKELLHDELIRVGETTGGKFVAWSGRVQELHLRIDSVVETARYPVLPGDLFWVENTPAGNEKAKSEADQDRRS